MNGFLAIVTKVLSTVLSALITFSGVFTNGKWSEQLNSLNSITKISDTHYMMDYTYDYDLDTLLESDTGNSTTAGLLVYALCDTFLQLNPWQRKIVAKLDSLTNFDSKKASNILTKIASGVGFACSTFNATTPDNDKLLARNYEYMDSPSMTVWTHPKDGYASVSTVSLYFLGYTNEFGPDNLVTSLLTVLAPYIPVDGMNEKGLSIGVLELETDVTFQQTAKKDITTTAMIRNVLDHAATVDEAIEIFNRYDMHDLLISDCTYHYQIADANGNTAIIEYANNETTIIRPDDSGILCATNFWLTDGIDDPEGMGQDRYEKIMSTLGKSNGVVTAKESMNLLKDVHMEQEDLHGYVCSTLWSVVYNNTKKTFDVCAMYDYDNVYHFSIDKPLSYTIN